MTATEVRPHNNSTAPANTATPFLSREQILQATSRCLREHGYDNTTIRRIASILDCAVGSIYRYYTDKRDLLSAVTQDRLEPVAALAGTTGSFEASVRLYHDLVSQTPEMYRLMFWLSYLDQSPTADRLPPVVRRVIDGWATQLGGITAARHAWATLHGLLLQGQTLDVISAALRDTLPAPSAARRPELPRIVVTMQEPPAPRPAPEPQADKPVFAEPVHAASLVPAAETADDVCLL
ncbi:MAG: TetR/AcrR family transcriptional regulator [Planctomycetes bacterium]|nr:TetR/AcrR family transcriptional regulator [Planctomycetota bacterium]